MRTLRAVFAVHGAITLAGAVVLIVFPTAIPSAVGITLERSDYLLVYLVAAAKLAVAVLSFGAIRTTDRLHGTNGAERRHQTPGTSR